jgi:hypothetical protein
MKLDIQEVFFLKQCAEAATIKGSDAPIVAKTIEKIEKEFARLESLQQKQPK